ncbi:hypothetical protein KEM52_003467 [Ascosphaera acerosa]|nr:hypothetical protein KEM52_003467 [Ascosphaera acerosa]
MLAVGRMRLGIHLNGRAPAPSRCLVHLGRRTTGRPASSLHRARAPARCDSSDFPGTPYTSRHDAPEPTRGPLAGARSPRSKSADTDDVDPPPTDTDAPSASASSSSSSRDGRPRLTPRLLKRQLDQFVVGQERAKRLLSVAVFNHYQRIHELERRQRRWEERWLRRQRELEDVGASAEDGASDQDGLRTSGPRTNPRPVDVWDAPSSPPPSSPSSRRPAEADDPDPPDHPSSSLLQKSNILLLGPSGVGKTLMAKTLANVLSVPFSISDCTPFTQAGYIGEDVETCVARLLAAADYDVDAAERGIIVLDELDKLAATRSIAGSGSAGGGGGGGGGQKDVGGEGVQQALLKIIEGTTVQVQAKPERTPPPPSPPPPPSSPPSISSLGSITLQPHARPGDGRPATSPPPRKEVEIHNVRTDNILFIVSGAFVGLEKHVMDRLSKGSMGFGQPIRKRSQSGFASPAGAGGGSGGDPTGPDMLVEDENAGGLPPILPGSEEEALYKAHRVP